MIPFPRKQEVTTIEGTKEKLGEPIDYLSLVLNKLAFALSLKPGSKQRQLELNDLEDLLFPFLDDTFREEMAKLEGEKAQWNGKPGWNAAYHRGRVKVLLSVMKRNDMLTLGTI